jgi:SAM-dependent methyltransferase
MSKQAFKVAKAFWHGLKSYPSYPFLKERRLVEIAYILRSIPSEAESLLDFGCGDGSTLVLLRELSSIKELWGLDLSERLIEIGKTKLGNTASLAVADFTEVEEIPPTDITLSLGVLPYIFDLELARRYLALIGSRRLILRSPCSVEGRIEINKYSEDLGAQYAAVYRTLEEIEELLTDRFDILSVERAYPDEIESKYGTKQFFFVCEQKN